jgi:hypothetical protein
MKNKNIEVDFEKFFFFWDFPNPIQSLGKQSLEA